MTTKNQHISSFVPVFSQESRISVGWSGVTHTHTHTHRVFGMNANIELILP